MPIGRSRRSARRRPPGRGSRRPDLDPILQAGLGHAPARQLGLGGRERDAEGVHAMFAGGVDHEAAPAAADVEDTLALLQPQLRADQLALCVLRLLEGAGAAREQRAAVGHRLIEKQREELVRDVVVVAHRALVALAAVPVPARAQLAGGDRAAAASIRTRAGRQHQARARGAVDRRGAERVEQPDHPVEVVGFELARRVCPSEPELSGGAQQMGDRGGERTVNTGPSATVGPAPSRPRSAAQTGAPAARARARGAAAQDRASTA